MLIYAARAGTVLPRRFIDFPRISVGFPEMRLSDGYPQINHVVPVFFHEITPPAMSSNQGTEHLSTDASGDVWRWGRGVRFLALGVPNWPQKTSKPFEKV